MKTRIMEAAERIITFVLNYDVFDKIGGGMATCKVCNSNKDTMTTACHAEISENSLLECMKVWRPRHRKCIGFQGTKLVDLKYIFYGTPRK